MRKPEEQKEPHRIGDERQEYAGPHLAITLPASITQFEVPAAVTDGGGQFKFEIIARTSTGNNTAIEGCFSVQ